MIAALIRRIRAFEQGDAGAVLDLQALVETGELLRLYTGSDDGVPFEVVRVVAWLHWRRYQALPFGQSLKDAKDLK